MHFEKRFEQDLKIIMVFVPEVVRSLSKTARPAPPAPTATAAANGTASNIPASLAHQPHRSRTVHHRTRRTRQLERRQWRWWEVPRSTHLQLFPKEAVKVPGGVLPRHPAARPVAWSTAATRANARNVTGRPTARYSHFRSGPGASSRKK